MFGADIVGRNPASCWRMCGPNNCLGWSFALSVRSDLDCVPEQNKFKPVLRMRNQNWIRIDFSQLDPDRNGNADPDQREVL